MKRKSPQRTKSPSEIKVFRKLANNLHEIHRLQASYKKLRAEKRISVNPFFRLKIKEPVPSLDFLKSMKRTGLRVMKFSPLRLFCRECCTDWQPKKLPGGKLPNGYWRCPNGCNRHKPAESKTTK
jgi:hypothetical protein